MDDMLKQDLKKMMVFKRYGYNVSASIKSVVARAGRLEGSVLEIGTGRGHMAAALARKWVRFTSIDLDKNGQKIARAQLKEIGRVRSVIMKIMNAENLKFKDGSFDYVISFNFVHHAKDPVRCLKEMVRVARKKLVVADINNRGQRIMAKVHKLDGQEHEESKISARATIALLRKMGRLKVHRELCQNIYILTKNDE